MRRLLWLSAMACLLVAGCTASGHEAPQRGDEPWPLSGATRFSAAQTTALRQLEERRIRSCMRERGHEYRTAPRPDVRRVAAANPYGLLWAGWAGQDGYGITAEALAGPPPDPNASHLASLPKAERAAWQEALLGSDEDRQTVTLPSGVEITYDPRSCVEVATGAVYGRRWTALHHLMEDLTNEIVASAQATDRFRTAQGAWSDCMAERGHTYRRLHDPRVETHRRLERVERDPSAQRAVGRAELTLARDDVACQGETGLAPAVAEAQREAEAPSRSRWKEEIEEFRKLKEGALARIDRSAS